MGLGIIIFTKDFLEKLPKRPQIMPAAEQQAPREPINRVVFMVDAMIYIYQVMAVIQKQAAQVTTASDVELKREEYLSLAMKLFTSSILAHVGQCLTRLGAIAVPDYLGLYLVFDGSSPPAKLMTQAKRRQSRGSVAQERPLLTMMTEFQMEIQQYLGNELTRRFGDRYQLDRLIVNGTDVDGEGEWKCFRLARLALCRSTVSGGDCIVVVLSRDTDTFLYGLTVPSEYHDRFYLLYLSPKRVGEHYANSGDNNYFFSIENFVNVLAATNGPPIPRASGDWARISKRLIMALVGLCGNDYVASLMRSAPKDPLLVLSHIWNWALDYEPLGCLMVTLSGVRALRKVARCTGTVSFRMHDLINWHYYNGQIHKFIENAWSGSSNEIPFQLNYPSDEAMKAITRVTRELTCEHWLTNQYLFKTLLPISQ
jgi:hypothetical protein